MDQSLIDRYYQYFNDRRFADAAALLAVDAELDLLPGKSQRGRTGYLEFAEAWMAAFPNALLSIERVELRSETLHETYLLATGTHRGTFDFGMYRFRATGAEAVIHLRELLDIRGGSIVASVLSVDLTDLLSQLTTIHYDELSKRVERISSLRDPLMNAAEDPVRRREVANQIGVELDAARRALRPHFYR